MAKHLTMMVLAISVLSFFSACGRGFEAREELEQNSSLTYMNPRTESFVRFLLTDAPNNSLKSVVVAIDHLEVTFAGKGQEGRMILAKEFGSIDLLTLQNGVTVPMDDIVSPRGLHVQQIRLILKPEGHYAVKADNSICQLKTPSAERTGIKINFVDKYVFQAGHQYDIVVDFDALKSVTTKSNGTCIFKPVLKLKSAFQKSIELETGGEETPEQIPVPQPEPTPENPDFTIITLPTDPQLGTEGSTDLVTKPVQNDPVDDGWDTGAETEIPIWSIDDIRRI